jgi:hypothetical protein
LEGLTFLARSMADRERAERSDEPRGFRRRYPKTKNFYVTEALNSLLAEYGLSQFCVPEAESAAGRVRRFVCSDRLIAADAPRAELVQNDFAPRPVGDAFGVQMPDGRHVRATVRYAVVGQNDLPLSGNHIGDARYVASDKHWYVWLIQSANSAPAWIDP